ncbi:MAG: hypothetical protein WA071_22650 [Undibacterium umbellatum]|uniref:hypothetical protein n=1 Tax=Undibacterium umbellatum TaxID=2762300 RepID=UPI003BB7649B
MMRSTYLPAVCQASTNFSKEDLVPRTGVTKLTRQGDGWRYCNCRSNGKVPN